MILLISARERATAAWQHKSVRDIIAIIKCHSLKLLMKLWTHLINDGREKCFSGLREYCVGLITRVPGLALKLPMNHRFRYATRPTSIYYGREKIRECFNGLIQRCSLINPFT